MYGVAAGGSSWVSNRRTKPSAPAASWTFWVQPIFAPKPAAASSSTSHAWSYRDGFDTSHTLNTLSSFSPCRLIATASALGRLWRLGPRFYVSLFDVQVDLHVECASLPETEDSDDHKHPMHIFLGLRSIQIFPATQDFQQYDTEAVDIDFLCDDRTQPFRSHLPVEELVVFEIVDLKFVGLEISVL
ncbi:hypothetical protein RJ639_028300 [Escallonia herrerae]|uniref:Uncharacterized protein n=1 Tax=Escallonia herrerae TaxID=1293975 RepID=A0AA88X5R3_9ASTE|nr:hypothetical protein RJ639_028300 [Escallonia herrerae]